MWELLQQISTLLEQRHAEGAYCSLFRNPMPHSSSLQPHMEQEANRHNKTVHTTRTASSKNTVNSVHTESYMARSSRWFFQVSTKVMVGLIWCALAASRFWALAYAVSWLGLILTIQLSPRQQKDSAETVAGTTGSGGNTGFCECNNLLKMACFDSNSSIVWTDN